MSDQQLAHAQMQAQQQLAQQVLPPSITQQANLPMQINIPGPKIGPQAVRALNPVATMASVPVGQPIMQAKAEEPRNKAYKCTVSDCKESFTSPSELTVHILSHVGITCNESSLDEKVSLTEQMARLVEKPFVCAEAGCAARFTSKASLRRHGSTHSGDKPFKCSSCDKAFSRKEHLRRHENTHAGSKPFTCPDPGCGKRFSDRSALNRHRRSFPCPYPDCDRKFQRKDYLSAHINVHKQIKPYPCPECTKEFTTASYLKAHRRIHASDRPHKCQQPGCDKGFLRLACLKRHERTHREVKRSAEEMDMMRVHRCNHEGCGKRFTQRGHLTRHQKIHLGDRPFECPNPGCDKKFGRRDNLAQHQKTCKKK